jgi:hypothetical protein
MWQLVKDLLAPLPHWLAIHSKSITRVSDM